MKVFLLAGQSNMDGRANVKDLPAEFREISANLFMLKDNKWIPLTVSQGNSGKAFGPEISFGILMAKAFPREKIGLVKVSKGGTSLAGAWSPDSKAADALYVSLISQARQAMCFPKVKIEGLLWVQGESDAKEESAARMYQENLRKFIERVRKDLTMPNLPFIFNGDAEQMDAGYKKYPYGSVVRDAKIQVSKTVAGTRLVMNDGLTFNPDGIHYDAKGQIELGNRLYEAMLKILTGDKSPISEKNAFPMKKGSK